MFQRPRRPSVTLQIKLANRPQRVLHRPRSSATRRHEYSRPTRARVSSRVQRHHRRSRADPQARHIAQSKVFHDVLDDLRVRVQRRRRRRRVPVPASISPPRAVLAPRGVDVIRAEPADEVAPRSRAHEQRLEARAVV